MDTPVKRYSSGMYVRLAFSVAAHFEPEIMLVDEVLAVGDAEFQKRCMGRMEDLGQSGRTVVFVSHNMQAISQLCDRALHLDGGRLVNEGPADEVVAHYLQTVGATGSERVWEDLATAPGTAYVKLRSARVVSEDGSTAAAIDVRESVGIEIGFTVLEPPTEPITPKIKLVDGRGDVVFNAIDTSARWHEPPEPGEYTSTAWIPGNLLNEGFILADVAVVSHAATRHTHYTAYREAVSFHVQDPAEGGSARGLYTGQWKGVVRTAARVDDGGRLARCVAAASSRHPTSRSSSRRTSELMLWSCFSRRSPSKTNRSPSTSSSRTTDQAVRWQGRSSAGATVSRCDTSGSRTRVSARPGL